LIGSYPLQVTFLGKALASICVMLSLIRGDAGDVVSEIALINVTKLYGLQAI